MNKWLLSPPGLVFLGLAIVGLSVLLGKLFGASFYAMGTIVILFLIALIAYLVFHLMDEPLLQRLRNCLFSSEEGK